jgi:hypothetical protein
VKAKIPAAAITQEQEKQREKSNEKSNRRMLNYAHRSLMVSARENLGFGGERLRRLSYNSYDVGEGYIADHTDKRLLTSVEDLMAGAEAVYAETDFFETVENTYSALRRDLRLFGFDPDVSVWGRQPFTGDDFPSTWRKVTASQRKRREAFLFYANEMSQMCRTMLCMGAIELHQTNGVGAERMERVMIPVREDWFRLMRVYLTMDSDAVNRELKAMLDRFNMMGCFAEEYAL